MLGQPAAFIIKNPQPAAGEFQGAADRFKQPLAIAGPRAQAIDNHLDGVPRTRRQRRRILDVVGLAVDAQPHEAAAGQLAQQLQMFALAIVDHRRQQHDPALPAGDQGLCDLFGSLAGQRQAVFGAVGLAYARIQQAQIVEDFGDGADRRAGIVRGGLLFDRYRWRQAVDRFDFRLVHQFEKLAGVGGKRFDIAALSFRINGVKSQRRLAGAGQAGEHGHLAAGNAQVHRLEVVDAGVLYVDAVDCRSRAQI